jgi:WD40 repeat protein
MVSTRIALVLSLLAAPLAAAEPGPPAVATAADAALAAAGMALELDRTADAERWLASVPAKERGWVWRLLSGQADRSLGVVVDTGKPLVATALSANGQRVAAAPSKGEIVVVATDSYEEAARLDPADVSTRAIALSPSGDLLFVASGDGRLRIWDVQRKRMAVQWPGNSDELLAVAWSPNGATLAVGGFVRDPSGRPKGVVTLYTPLGLELRSFEPRAQFVGALAFSPDSALLVAAGPQGQLSAFDPSGALPPRHMQLEGAEGRAQIDGLAFAPDGKQLAAACGDGTVRIWRLPDWQPLVALPSGAGGGTGVNAVTFSADGARLASAGRPSARDSPAPAATSPSDSGTSPAAPGPPRSTATSARSPASRRRPRATSSPPARTAPFADGLPAPRSRFSITPAPRSAL